MQELYEAFKKSRWFPFVIGIVLIIFGIVGIINSGIRTEMLAVYAGVLFIVYALYEILSGVFSRTNKKKMVINFAVAIVLIVLAVLTFANKSMVGKYLPALVGFFMIICAFADLFYSLILLKNKRKLWWTAAVLGVVIFIIGLVFVIKPGYVAQFFGILTGIALILIGISNLVSFFLFKKK